MKYFGTDGIRGLAGIDLSKSLISKVAKAIITYYKKHKLKKVILIGNDTRISSDYILAELSSTLLKYGISIHNIGVCSSPSLAWLVKKFNYPLGLMLSASHNPSEYNGIKFFNSKGEKVDDEFEEEFEYLMDKKHSPQKQEFSQHKYIPQIKDSYISWLKKLKKFNFSCIVDCSNGATSEYVKKIFTNCEVIHSSPDGININKNSGCTHIEKLQSLCVKKKKIGIAFDGDGDRIHLVSETGEIINGDKVLYILSKFFLKDRDSLVGTIYTNSALEETLSKNGIKLIRAYVGDKNVYNKMIEHNTLIGGEESGHIILRSFMNTGDGILTAIILCNMLHSCKQTLSTLLIEYHEYYQARANIKTNGSFSCSNELNQLIKKYESSGSRILIRPSGTEPVIRIFVENKSKEIAEKIIKNLKNLLKI